MFSSVIYIKALNYKQHNCPAAEKQQGKLYVTILKQYIKKIYQHLIKCNKNKVRHQVVCTP